MAPKGVPRSPFGAILGTFGVPVPAFWRPLGHLWSTWGPTVDLVGFRGAGPPRELAGGRGLLCGVMAKHHFGLAGVGFT